MASGGIIAYGALILVAVASVRCIFFGIREL
jgi:hypothetical protein